MKAMHSIMIIFKDFKDARKSSGMTDNSLNIRQPTPNGSSTISQEGTSNPPNSSPRSEESHDLLYLAGTADGNLTLIGGHGQRICL
jgi:hypothetical protein